MEKADYIQEKLDVELTEDALQEFIEANYTEIGKKFLLSLDKDSLVDIILNEQIDLGGDFLSFAEEHFNEE